MARERYSFDEFVGAREASRRFSSLVDSVASGTARRFVVMYRNRPRAVLLSIEEYERLLGVEEASRG